MQYNTSIITNNGQKHFLVLFSLNTFFDNSFLVRTWQIKCMSLHIVGLDEVNMSQKDNLLCHCDQNYQHA